MGETRWSLKLTCQFHVWVLRPSHYFTKRVSATEESYVRTLSDCIPTTHNRRRRIIKIWIIFLFIYESFVVCPAVQYVTVRVKVCWEESSRCREMHTLVCDFWLSRSEQSLSFDFSVCFIMLLTSCHLVAIRRTILESKGCNPYMWFVLERKLWSYKGQNIYA